MQGDVITHSESNSIPEKKIRKRVIVCRIFLMFLSISFLGWLAESLYGLTCVGFTDRGLLVLPICPIYGVAYLFIWFLIRTPESSYWKKFNSFLHIRLKLSTIITDIIIYVLYFICTTIAATFVELMIGLIFDNVFGIRLWDYSNEKYSLFGLITPEFSLYWGILATFFMTIIHTSIYNAVCKIGTYRLFTISKVLAILLIADISFSFSYLIKFGKQFVLFKDKPLKLVRVPIKLIH